MTRTNTEYERMALEGRINLSDGHARHDLIADERAVIDDFSEIWRDVARVSQAQIEAEFFASFFALAGQGSQMGEQESRHLSYSASCSILIAAQIARSLDQTIYLLEPTFDNIYHILRSQGLAVMPVQQSEVEPDWILSNLAPGSVLWLTLPNNPTGFSLDEGQLRAVAAAVAKVGGSITIDFAYRFFCSDFYQWDQYEVLGQNVEYICLEDTGKTWATADFKFGALSCSDRFGKLAHKFHDELLLNVSPVALELVRRFIEVTRTHGGSRFIRARLEEPRTLVHRAMQEAGFVHKTAACANVPMELFGLPHGSSVEFWSRLRAKGIEVLPAHNYYWSARRPPSDQFRIPLTRPLAELREAMEAIRSLAAQPDA